jgi:hypothetical protein
MLKLQMNEELNLLNKICSIELIEHVDFKFFCTLLWRLGNTWSHIGFMKLLDL